MCTFKNIFKIFQSQVCQTPESTDNITGQDEELDKEITMIVEMATGIILHETH